MRRNIKSGKRLAGNDKPPRKRMTRAEQEEQVRANLATQQAEEEKRKREYHKKAKDTNTRVTKMVAETNKAKQQKATNQIAKVDSARSKPATRATSTPPKKQSNISEPTGLTDTGIKSK
jgi:hypothetical protein